MSTLEPGLGKQGDVFWAQAWASVENGAGAAGLNITVITTHKSLQMCHVRDQHNTK